MDQKQRRWGLGALILLSLLLGKRALAQTIQPAADGTGTQVQVQGDRIRVTGGRTSQDGANLFHSFEQFGLTADQIALFQSQADIRNILARVVGGDPSTIDGLLRVVGGNSNLFLINPSGIIFGPQARLDLPGSFVATTATGIGFGVREFSVVGDTNYSNLVGDPTNFSFALEEPGAIANLGNLRVANGDLSLFAGTVINTGSLAAPNGDLTVTAVPGSSRVRLSQEGSLLSLELEGLADENLNLRPATLPELLTGGGLNNASQLTVSADGTVRLQGSGIITAGDVALGRSPNPSVWGGNMLISAADDLLLSEAQVQAADDLFLLAGDRLQIRDSNTNAVRIIAGDDLVLRGNSQVDVFALSHPDSGFWSGGDMTLRSAQTVSADAHFFSGGNFRIRQLDGDMGDLFSPYDPIIRAQGNVSFNSYTGASLHVIASGRVVIPGSITITGADPTNGLQETVTLSNGDSILINGRQRPTLDIRAGVQPNVVGSGISGTPLPPGLRIQARPTSANISIGSILIDAPNGQVFLSTQYQPDLSLPGGNIRVTRADGISTDASTGLGGDIFIDSRARFTSAGTLDAATLARTSGDIVVLAQRNIVIRGSVNTFGNRAGDINLQSRRDIRINGELNADSDLGAGGDIVARAGRDLTIAGDVSATGTDGPGGSVNLQSTRDVQVGNVSTQAIGGTSNLPYSGGRIRLAAVDGNLQAGTVTTSGETGSGAIALRAGGTLALQDILASSGINGVGDPIWIGSQGTQTINSIAATSGGTGTDVSLVSREGSIRIGDVNTLGRDRGGNQFFQAAGAIVTGNLTSSASTGAAGNLTLTEAFRIQTGNLLASGVEGGNVTLQAAGTVETGGIFTRGSIGSGGDVLINPAGDVQVEQIDARGGTDGRGGAVSIVTNRFFRATGGTNADGNGSLISINTTGGLWGGPVDITHGGAAQDIPFTVGDASVNGTAGSITSGRSTIAPSQSFEGDYTQGNIAIRSREANPGSQDGDPLLNGDPLLDEDSELDDVARPLDNETSDGLVENTARTIDQEFSDDFEDYFGLPESGALSLQGVQGTLSNVAQATGLTPALVYVNFVPRAVDTGDSGNDSLELVLVTPEGDLIRKRVLQTTRSQVLATAARFRNEVTNPARTRTASYLAPAQQLYQWLVAPLEEDLQGQGIDNLAFIFDQGLRSLPVAALHDGQHFLVERYSIGLMPSLALVDTRYRDIRNNQVLAMGASQFTDQLPLPAVPIELEEVATQVWRGEYFLNQDFTLKNLLAQRDAQPFGIVHLATHGEFRPGDPSNSYIQFWDQRLQLDQLRQMNLNNPPVNLLVLSACRTAMGDAQAELGFAGLALQAGVQSALASLWYVSDAGTLALMTEFYQNLQDVPMKAEALRQAQLAMLRGEVQLDGRSLVSRRRGSVIELPSEFDKGSTPNLAHPYYWAGFTMIGSPW
ncbi:MULTISPECIES: CHAT domain-containing protein [unclassified Leptolyngbya]|uniref:CHAT domain-containing protein n=1 Tax=unclassified Leptolyngbya TaxID=2650499 RepID=UPI001683F864|nr:MULTISPECIES: CHAT domain-containing protein [unclassified Leptolyngbya]MBD1911495.1 CHAT domain-containing protein [Leptolyngbya sp. FACHB-8]MBD2155264.1 CHAT domain-containing protein [Leptolyngbya sp. FACHB-16]